MDDIWQKNFSDQSFPRIKYEYYSGKLFENEQIELTPQIRISYKLEKNYNHIRDTLESLFSNLKRCFVSLQGHFFTENQLNSEFAPYIPDDLKRDKIVKFILTTYSTVTIMGNKNIDEDAFLQGRKGANHKKEYRIFSRQYNRNFSTLLHRFSSMFSSNNIKEATRYVSTNSELLINYIRLGSILEIMGLASYESLGGDSPMLFIRINDPLRIKRDAEDKNYTNGLLNKTKRKHETSSQIFDHFFLHSFENDERWNFIEDCFLGKSNDELFELYPGGEKNHMDIVQYLSNNVKKISPNDTTSPSSNSVLHIFPPREGELYTSDRLLTLDNQTMKIRKWIIHNPVALDKAVRKYKLSIPYDYKVLQSKLLNNHFEYYRDVMGLNLWIDFPGYERPIAASIPYNTDPIKFYKWWKNNEDKVSLSFKEKILLFINVEHIKPGTLIKRHQALLTSISTKHS